jgi:hypothetical protein
MAGTGNAVDFEWFQYTDDQGNTWAAKTDKDWGAAGASGFGTFDPADLPFPKTGRYRIRRVQLIDNVSGRITRRPLGTLAATAGVRGATVVTVARGQTGSYTLTSQGIIGERIPKTGVIVSKPEPVTT